MVFFDEISRHTGLSQEDINKNLENKKTILGWLIKNKLRDLNSFGKVMNLYYNSPEKLQSIIKRNEISVILSKKEVKDNLNSGK